MQVFFSLYVFKLRYDYYYINGMNEKKKCNLTQISRCIFFNFEG